MKPTDYSNQRPLLQIKLENLLSFGPGSTPLKLENLNVLIGPNAAGKSNLIEALSLMRSTAVPQTSPSTNADLRGVVRRGGGVNEWVWKGGGSKSASLDVVVHNPQGQQPLRHVLSFRSDPQGFSLEDERIENETPYIGQSEPYFYYQLQNGHPRR
jgi:predicted ATPase